MDRIRKALDLARADRARLLDGEAGASPSSGEPRQASGLPQVIEYTRTRVYSPNSASLEANRIINPLRNDSAAAAFRMLRTQVLQRMEEKGWRSIAILSPHENDGKTTTAINLAIGLAHDNRHTVLLVDCDLKRPAIAGKLDLTPELGLNDVLCGAAGIDQCLYHPEGFPRLVVLPGRAPLANSSDALSGLRGRALASELRERYPERIVVFDLPPLLGADDALAFLPLVECGLMVVAERATRREDLLRCMELTCKTPIIGTVLNRASTVAPAYG
jgi:protein-tyrosine kinase